MFSEKLGSKNSGTPVWEKKVRSKTVMSVVFINKPICSILTCKTNLNVSAFCLSQKNKNKVNFCCKYLETTQFLLQKSHVNTEINGINMDGQRKKKKKERPVSGL